VPTIRFEIALLISPSERDHATLRRLCREAGWPLYLANSLQGASSLLQSKAAFIVLTETELPIGSWKDVLDAVRLLPVPPSLVVSSKGPDDYLWAEALNLGAFDVLATPLNLTEVTHVFESAWLRHQQRMRTKNPQ
jgi:DNA-binding response OmpR family regulator